MRIIISALLKADTYIIKCFVNYKVKMVVLFSYGLTNLKSMIPYISIPCLMEDLAIFIKFLILSHSGTPKSITP